MRRKERKIIGEVGEKEEENEKKEIEMEIGIIDGVKIERIGKDKKILERVIEIRFKKLDNEIEEINRRGDVREEESKVRKKVRRIEKKRRSEEGVGKKDKKIEEIIKVKVMKKKIGGDEKLVVSF